MSLREHLQEIYDRHGLLTPQIVVDEVRNPKHPLHSYVFDRKPKEAAEAWYRHRAHELITSVRVSYRKADGTESSIRAFHAVRKEIEDNGGFAYQPSEEVIADPFLTKLVLQDMERDWKTLKKRYEDFQEFWQLVQSEAEAKAS